MDDEAVVDWNGLVREFGWPKSRTQTYRLIAEGKFPASLKLPGAVRESHRYWKRRFLVEFFKGLQPKK